MNSPRIVVKNFIFNEMFEPSLWNYDKKPTEVTFDSQISDFEVSYLPSEPVALGQQPEEVPKTAAFIVVVNDSNESFTVIALGQNEKTPSIGSGGLFIAGTNKVNNSVQGESINHRGSQLACSKELDKLPNPVLKLYLMNCILVANGVSSPVMNFQLNEVKTIAVNPKFTNINFNYYLVNIPGFLPVSVKRDGNTAAIVWQNAQANPTTTTAYLKEQFLVAIYALDQSHQPVKLLTPADLNATQTDSDLVLLSIVPNADVDSMGTHYVFVSVVSKDPKPKLTGPLKKILHRNVLNQTKDDFKPRTNSNFMVNDGYFWDLALAIVSDKGISPTVDRFTFSTITE